MVKFIQTNVGKECPINLITGCATFIKYLSKKVFAIMEN